ncbi:MAG: hypothetical protein GY906_04750 [bacterium]|nr:hypothetical protein [bacterium]
MSNELSAFNSVPVSAAALSTEQAAPRRKFPARLQLVSKGRLVDSGKVRPGGFAVINGDEILDIGNNVDVIPLAVLDKALDVGQGSGEVRVAFGANNELFKEIKAASATVNSGCMYGPVFLVFERYTASFVELFFNNKSGRMEADKLKAHCPVNSTDAEALGIEARPARAANIASKYIEKERFSWFAPEITTAEGVTFDRTPTAEELLETVNTFLAQGAEAPASEGRDR